MSYATFELGFKTTPSQGLSIGLGLGGSLPVMTTGSYLLSVYLPDEPPDLHLYTHGFGRIQRPFLPMASLCVAQSIGHLRGWRLSLEARLSHAFKPIFRPQFWIPLNPSLSSLSLGLVWDIFQKQPHTP